jgi:hypothetical protein
MIDMIDSIPSQGLMAIPSWSLSYRLQGIGTTRSIKAVLTFYDSWLAII